MYPPFITLSTFFKKHQHILISVALGALLLLSASYIGWSLSNNHAAPLYIALALIIFFTSLIFFFHHHEQKDDILFPKQKKEKP